MRNMYYLRSKWVWSLILGIFGIAPSRHCANNGRHSTLTRQFSLVGIPPIVIWARTFARGVRADACMCIRSVINGWAHCSHCAFLVWPPWPIQNSENRHAAPCIKSELVSPSPGITEVVWYNLQYVKNTQKCLIFPLFDKKRKPKLSHRLKLA